MAGRGFVVQQSVRAEIVREINFRQLVAVQVRHADGQRPAVIDFRADDVGHLDEMHRRMFARRRAGPEKEMFSPAGKRLGKALVHGFHPAGVRVENVRAVLKIISDEHVNVAVTVEIGLSPRRWRTTVRRSWTSSTGS